MGFCLEGREHPLGWREDDTLLIGGKRYDLDWREENTLLIGGEKIRS